MVPENGVLNKHFNKQTCLLLPESIVVVVKIHRRHGVAMVLSNYALVLFREGFKK